ncbi:hypothetical protein [Burkholderia gladioli]|uniref:hypothetical protein n=1 Tax=Burkholderia gladioli TaxID=28095 RepID=UPI00163DF454|nr:hypothetical protein [Burkholderia gladioli]
MHILNWDAAIKVVSMIKDSQNRVAQSEAMRLRDRWLVEADAGTLQMTLETRYALEKA